MSPSSSNKMVSSWLVVGLLLFASSTRKASSFVPRAPSGTFLTSSRLSHSRLYSERSSESEPTQWLDSGFDPSLDLDGPRSSEFHALEPVDHSETRRARFEQEELARVRFAALGDELWTLREDMDRLSQELIVAVSKGNKESEKKVRERLMECERRDPELVYELNLKEVAKAAREGDEEKAQYHQELANDARGCLPHLNLEGLWVGKYGDHGYEMINVTYTGDILTAYKVTGDKNVPKGEITFEADLNPLKLGQDGKTAKELKPIKLTEGAAKKWGTSQLPRYAGTGRVAEEGFINTQLMNGQLIIIGSEYFSFAWLPISHQIFFGRPSAELSLKMLREAGTSTIMGTGSPPPDIDDDVSALRAYAGRCLETTELHIEEEILEGKPDEFSCIWHDEDTDECYFE